MCVDRLSVITSRPMRHFDVVEIGRFECDRAARLDERIVFVSGEEILGVENRREPILRTDRIDDPFGEERRLRHAVQNRSRRDDLSRIFTREHTVESPRLQIEAAVPSVGRGTRVPFGIALFGTNQNSDRRLERRFIGNPRQIGVGVIIQLHAHINTIM